MSPWKLMLLPFLECLVLVGIHSYLGLHVLRRKVIFVDLALAQIAALGSVVAMMAGLEAQTTGSYIFSLLFTFIGAAVFSLTRLRQEKVPQEAVIGLVYALAAALAILLIDRAPHGAEHIKEVLTGTILWVNGKTVLTAAVVYSGVGLFHYIYRERFLQISEHPEAAFQAGVKVRLWDFLFYMSFGLVITLSVHTAGVLLVFVFLVVPAIMGMVITDRIGLQLLIGWGVGVLVSFVGMALSYSWDFPAGPMVVSVYGFALLIVALVLFVVRAQRRSRALLYVVAGIVVMVIIGFGFKGLGAVMRNVQGPSHPHHAHSHQDQQVDGPGHLHPGESDELGHRGHDSHAHRADLGALDSQQAARELLAALQGAQGEKALKGCTKAAVIESAFALSDDEEIKLNLALRWVELAPSPGLAALLRLMGEAEMPLTRDGAFEALKKHSGDGFGYDPSEANDNPQNQQALQKWRLWLHEF